MLGISAGSDWDDKEVYVQNRPYQAQGVLVVAYGQFVRAVVEQEAGLV